MRRIRNNTSKKLVFYFGDSHQEEPTAIKTLEVGEDVDLDRLPNEDISIQED